MEIKIEKCPYCGSSNFEWVGDAFEEGNATPYHCHDCDLFFGEEEVRREEMRHRLSALLMHTSEECQRKCDIVLEENDENVGLSTLEMPRVVSCFQDGEGIIWFYIYGCINAESGEKEYTEFDSLKTCDLQTILNALLDEVCVNREQALADEFTNKALELKFGERFTALENVEDDAEINKWWEFYNEEFYELLIKE